MLSIVEEKNEYEQQLQSVEYRISQLLSDLASHQQALITLQSKGDELSARFPTDQETEHLPLLERIDKKTTRFIAKKESYMQWETVIEMSVEEKADHAARLTQLETAIKQLVAYRQQWLGITARREKVQENLQALREELLPLQETENTMKMEIARCDRILTIKDPRLLTFSLPKIPSARRLRQIEHDSMTTVCKHFIYEDDEESDDDAASLGGPDFPGDDNSSVVEVVESYFTAEEDELFKNLLTEMEDLEVLLSENGEALGERYMELDAAAIHEDEMDIPTTVITDSPVNEDLLDVYPCEQDPRTPDELARLMFDLLVYLHRPRGEIKPMFLDGMSVDHEGTTAFTAAHRYFWQFINVGYFSLGQTEMPVFHVCMEPGTSTSVLVTSLDMLKRYLDDMINDQLVFDHAKKTIPPLGFAGVLPNEHVGSLMLRYFSTNCLKGDRYVKKVELMDSNVRVPEQLGQYAIAYMYNVEFNDNTGTWPLLIIRHKFPHKPLDYSFRLDELIFKAKSPLAFVTDFAAEVTPAAKLLHIA